MKMERLIVLASCSFFVLSAAQVAQAQDADDFDRLCDPVVSANGNGVRSANGSLVGHASSAPCPDEPATVAVEREVVVVQAEPAPPAPEGAVIFFPYDVAELTSEGERVLDELSDLAAGYEPSSVRVAGYADRAGLADYNMELSEARAANVEAALVASGLSEALITTEAFGESNLAVETDDGVALEANRRAVVSVDYQS